MPDDDAPPPAVPRRRGGGAVAVAAGIFLSRIAGLVRERVIAHYLGLSAAAAALRAAMRIPNVLQNLLGEGVLSTSFIPVYKRLLAEGRHDDARRVARVIATLLALVAAVLAALGVLAAGPLVDLLAPFDDPATRELTVRLVQIIFPGTAILVLSAWCLGVLNSHERFFLPYVSPVLWNAAIIGTAIVAGRRLAGFDDDVAVWIAWGTVGGAVVQLLVQLPAAFALVRGFAPSLAARDPGVREAFRNFVPAVIGRGSVQISAFVDQVLATLLGEAIVAGMANAQTLTMLPVSLFGMAISAAELPAMAGVAGEASVRAQHVRDRLRGSQRRVVFLVMPSAIAFVAIGGAIVSLLFETGRFGARDTELVWFILAGSALGLVANTQGRLLASALFVVGAPRRAMYAGLARVAIGIALGTAVVLPLRDAFGYSIAWGAFGLTAAASVAGWVEYVLLLRWLRAQIGAVEVPTRLALGAFAAAALAGGAGYGTTLLARELGVATWLGALAAVAVFGGVYLGVMAIAKVPEARAFTRRLLRR
jgi:putative peptidoglycan lipid II flippase